MMPSSGDADPPTGESSWLVECSRPGERLDVYLRERFPTVSRGAIQRLLARGDILVDGRAVKATHRPRAGERLLVRWPVPEPAVARAQAIPFEVLYEDDSLLVLNKPPGLVVHPAAGHPDGTLVNALLHHCAGRLSGVGGVARPGIVHRLDKETSGCLVVAKDDSAHLALSAQFAGRTVEKVYHALVCGELPADRGEIRTALGRHPTERKRMAVVSRGGREAWTSYRMRERLWGSTLVEAELHTGRTHQVRVHFLHLGCPLVGDAVYGRRQNQRFVVATGCRPGRQMLHAVRLTFQHPRNNRRITVEAPWPDDFRQTVEILRRS